MYYETSKNAAIVGKFVNDGEPDLLHTKLEVPVVSLREITATDDGKIKKQGDVVVKPGSFEKILNAPGNYIVIGGGSGAGKTRFTREFSYSNFTILLDAIAGHEDGGTLELKELIKKCETLSPADAEEMINLVIPCVFLFLERKFFALLLKNTGKKTFYPVIGWCCSCLVLEFSKTKNIMRITFSS